MANQNFVVHNGLSVGSTTLFAANSGAVISGDVVIGGNITVQGTGLTFTGTPQIGGITDATLADATSLAIALGG